MAKDIVTVIRCSRCHRDGTLSVEGDRLWCSCCGDWAACELRQCRNAIVTEGEIPTLVRAPPLSTPLQPLRVPAGWLVEYNNGLYEVDPAAEQIPETDRWWLFKQDMLLLRHKRRNRLLDVGWYPDGDLLEGQYGLVVHEGDFQGRLLHEFSTRDRLVLVVEIERLLRAVTDGLL